MKFNNRNSLAAFQAPATRHAHNFHNSSQSFDLRRSIGPTCNICLRYVQPLKIENTNTDAYAKLCAKKLILLVVLVEYCSDF